jgi:hypothetical protein
MNPDAEFVLTAPPLSIGSGTHPIVGLMIRNESNAERYFCARFAVAPFVGDIWPTLTGPSGNEVSFALRVRLGPIRSSDFILLAPGEAILAGFQLRRFFRCDQPGRYHLSAKYVSREVPTELATRPVFVGELTSAVQFTV